MFFVDIFKFFIEDEYVGDIRDLLLWNDYYGDMVDCYYGDKICCYGYI